MSTASSSPEEDEVESNSGLDLGSKFLVFQLDLLNARDSNLVALF
jgi:hypothetical protein